MAGAHYMDRPHRDRHIDRFTIVVYEFLFEIISNPFLLSVKIRNFEPNQSKCIASKGYE